MKTQQEAERAEQQRIKNLVLNYDLQDSSAEPGTGSINLLTDPFLHPNPNKRVPLLSRTFLSVTPKYSDKNEYAHNAIKGTGASDKHQQNAPLYQNSAHHTTTARSADRPSSTRNVHRARKLQLSDVDWYEQSPDQFPMLPLVTGSLPQRR